MTARSMAAGFNCLIGSTSAGLASIQFAS